MLAQIVLHNALQVYRILLKATACVQPVSCDEAYLDVTGLGDPEEIVSSIRQQIFDATGCTASAGVGSTMLTARLATKKGKPNGQYRIHPHEVCKSVNQSISLTFCVWRTHQRSQKTKPMKFLRMLNEHVATGHAASAGCLLNGSGLPSQNNISSESHLHQ